MRGCRVIWQELWNGKLNRASLTGEAGPGTMPAAFRVEAMTGGGNIGEATGELWTVLRDGVPICFAVSPTSSKAIEFGRAFLGLLLAEELEHKLSLAERAGGTIEARPPTDAEHALFASKLAKHGGFGRFVLGLPIDAAEALALTTPIPGRS